MRQSGKEQLNIGAAHWLYHTWPGFQNPVTPSKAQIVTTMCRVIKSKLVKQRKSLRGSKNISCLHHHCWCSTAEQAMDLSTAAFQHMAALLCLLLVLFYSTWRHILSRRKQRASGNIATAAEDTISMHSPRHRTGTSPLTSSYLTHCC